MTETINVANIDKVHKNPIAELVQTACQFESHIDISSEGKNINAKLNGDYGIWIKRRNVCYYFSRRQ